MRHEDPNSRFSIRSRQVLGVLLATPKAMSYSEIRSKIVGATSSTDDWELTIGLVRLEESGIVVSHHVRRSGFAVKLYEIPTLQRLAMILERPEGPDGIP
jgi:hypothetical protein